MFYLNWRFTLIALSVAPVLFVVVYTYTRRIKKASREVRKKEGEIVSVIQEVLSSIRVVKAFAREDYEQRRLEEESLESVEIALRARSLKAKLVAVGGDHRGGRHRPGAVVRRAHGAGRTAVGGIADRLHPVSGEDVQADAGTLQDDRRLFEGGRRIRAHPEVLDTDGEMKDLPGARPRQRFRGEIEFDKVSFGYDPSVRFCRT